MTQSPLIYDGKWALVTGSSRGIGRLIATHLLEKGANVVGFSRGQSTIFEPKYNHISMDLSDLVSIDKSFKTLRKLTSSLDILVNNAAIAISQPSLLTSSKIAQEIININYLGAFIVCRESAKMMYKNKWGRIVNIGSMMTRMEPLGGVLYASTKAALITQSNIMAKELASVNITSNTIGVTAIDTDMLRQHSNEYMQTIISQLPLPRLAEIDDILNVFDFFASERSSYVTAQTVYLGGVT